ncbi:MAG: response regulator transcription factor [Actinobacteria bacterium]|nr:response regulator transcription factor [Actinomycetota bacterium]
MSGRVLLADDEGDILEPVSYALRSAGFEVDCATDGESALEAALEGDYDVVVLDVVMPGLSGTDVCRRLRAASAVPIVMLTARDGEVERVVGLELGADDYVTKPFSTAELVSRLRAILRRREFDRASGTARLELGRLSIDPAEQSVRVHGEEVSLTRMEFAILMVLAQHPGRVVGRREILERAWQTSFVADERACDSHIFNLRAKIEDDPEQPQRLLTVHGAGYKLVQA